MQHLNKGLILFILLLNLAPALGQEALDIFGYFQPNFSYIKDRTTLRNSEIGFQSENVSERNVLYPDPGLSQAVVIVHKSVPLESASAAEIADIYQLKVRSWEDDSRITVFNLKTDGKLKNAFYAFIKQNPLNLRKLWLRLQLTGEATPPKSTDTEDAMVKKVASTPGAIGFVSKEKINDDVKVIAVIP